MLTGWRQATRLAEWSLDRLVASDPGMTRLLFALRVVFSVLLTVVILLLVAGLPFTVVIVGALLSVNVAATLNAREPRVLLLAAGTALGYAAAALVLAAALVGHRALADVVFLLIIFLGVYLRRFPSWGFTAGFGGFMSFFVAQFTHVDLRALPLAIACAGVGIGCALAVVTVMTFAVRTHAVERMASALRARLLRMVSQVTDALRTGELDGWHDRRLSRASDQLHEAALMIESELEQSADLDVDDRLRQQVVSTELAGERLAVVTRWALAAGVSAACRQQVAHELDQVRRFLRRDPAPALRVDEGELLAAVRSAEPGGEDAGSAPATDARLRQAVRELVLVVVQLRRTIDRRRVSARARPQEQAADQPDSGDDEQRQDAAVRWRDRWRVTTRQAVQAVVAGAMAITGGELLSEQRWYWAVITAFVVFAGTTSRGDLLVKGFGRALGTVLGVVIGLAVAVPVAGNRPVAVALLVVSVFLAFYFQRLSHAVMSFFITVMLSVLFDLIGQFSSTLLALRVAETAIGVVAGALAAMFVLPTRTAAVMGEKLVAALRSLRDFLGDAEQMLAEGEAVNLIERSREVDRDVDDLVASASPLLYRMSPFRGRRDVLSYLVSVVELCAYRARTLASAAETAALANLPGFSENVRRVQINLDRLVARVTGDGPRKRLAAGAGLADGRRWQPRSRIGHRLLVYFDRLDDAVVALARPVDNLWGRGMPQRDGAAPRAWREAADPPTIPLDLSPIRHP